MQNIFKDILKDKNGEYSFREIATLLFVLILTASWAVDTFTHFQVQEYMFYAFSSLVGAGVFGYSLERKTKQQNGNRNHE